jgi:hypothetical protein
MQPSLCTLTQCAGPCHTQQAGAQAPRSNKRQAHGQTRSRSAGRSLQHNQCKMQASQAVTSQGMAAHTSRLVHPAQASVRVRFMPWLLDNANDCGHSHEKQQSGVWDAGPCQAPHPSAVIQSVQQWQQHQYACLAGTHSQAAQRAPRIGDAARQPAVVGQRQALQGKACAEASVSDHGG